MKNKKLSNNKIENPLYYNHKYDCMKLFAEHFQLRDVSLRTMQAYYCALRLLYEHFGKNPKYLTQKQIRSYIIYLKEDRGWCPSSLRQSIASCLVNNEDMTPFLTQ
jgi:hypothetical protein